MTLSLSPLCAQEENGISMLQQEKNIRTQLEALMKEKTRRMQQLKALVDQDQDLCDILCSMPYGISPDSVPSLEQLENFCQHITNQNAEKVGARFVTSAPQLFSYFDWFVIPQHSASEPSNAGILAGPVLDSKIDVKYCLGYIFTVM